MINDTIQELLDGTLGDEQSAELLHLLSVNPERRADFHRHLALQGAMQRDRAASALSASEDAEIWGVLAGLGTATVSAGSNSGSFGWLARAAAVVVVGIVGYLLGSNSSTNIFTGSGAGNSTALNVTRQQTAPRQTTQSPAPAPASTGTGGGTGGGTGAAAAQTTPRVIYRDRIVYRYAPSASRPADPTAEARNGGSPAMALNNDPQASSPALSNGAGNGGPSVTPNAAASAEGKAPEAVNGAPSSAPSTPPSSSSAAEKKNSAAAIDPNSVLGREELRSNGEQPAAPNAEPAIASFLRDGFEVGLSDHEGLITPAPEGKESDPSFSNRHVNLSYRMLDGRFGLGARFGYGTFAMVSLGSTLRTRSNAKGELASVETNLYPVVKPQQQFLTEFFLNYRLPVGGRFALGLESSLGVSAKHSKAGGDASVLWFVNDHIGMHAGAGLGYYWYDLRAANEEALLNSPDNTSVLEMSDAYRGTVLEFKYGLFYHF